MLQSFPNNIPPKFQKKIVIAKYLLFRIALLIAESLTNIENPGLHKFFNRFLEVLLQLVSMSDFPSFL